MCICRPPPTQKNMFLDLFLLQTFSIQFPVTKELFTSLVFLTQKILSRAVCRVFSPALCHLALIFPAGIKQTNMRGKLGQLNSRTMSVYQEPFN